MSQARFANGDPVTFANGDAVSHGPGQGHVAGNDRVVDYMPRLPAGVKPIGAVEIDWTHPLAKGLSVYMHQTGGGDRHVDALTDQRLLSSDTGTAKTGVQSDLGACMEITSSRVARYVDVRECTDYVANSKNFTICWEFVAASLGNTDGNMTWASGVTSSEPYILCNTNNGTLFQIYINTNYRMNWTAVTDELQRCVLTYDGATARLFVNGAEEGVYSNSTLGSYADTYFVMGSGYDSSQLGHYGNYALYLDRAFTQEQALSWSRDPYQILKPVTPQPQIITPIPAPEDGKVWL
jgi:hypothetical protein